MLAIELPALFVRVLAFVFGATWGSFFNVAIYRWPRDLSVVSPPSHCPACKQAIPAYRNVPLLGFLLLRGRAACCGARMSPRYFVVELIAGVLALAVAERFFVHAAPGVTAVAAGIETVLWFVFVGGLIVATFVDLEWMEIPDEVSIGGTALALATASFRPGVPLEEVVLGAGGGYLGVFLLLVFSWERLTGQRGMGEGDAKLAMYIGAFLGWRGALFALIAGSFQGVLAYVVARATGSRIGPDAATLEAAIAEVDGRDGSTSPHDAPPADPASASVDGEGSAASPPDAPPPDVETGDDDDLLAHRRIPFGPFLALGALEYLFFGELVLDWYFSLFA